METPVFISSISTTSSLRRSNRVSTIFEVALFGIGERVIIAGGSEYRHFHAGFNTSFEVDVFIQVHIGPIVDELNDRITRADTVDTPEALDYADRIPVYIVIDEIVAVL